ncbi:hypothetical protein BKA61DRAFT_646779 [Leptodontidium sp. MPI-SDFR-AT-0119]|nr:hypothetical protein BKA61DRAFT_646779 [Leptodontidium sp. MPI-SDFR-AT-0119]
MLSQKKRGGRPKKYADADTSRRANIEGNRRRRERKALQLFGPADFIAFEPLLSDVLLDTAPEIGLRASRDIRIPREHDIPTSDEDAEIARQIEQTRADEQETDLERREYNAEITQHMTAAEILLGMRSAGTRSEAEVEESQAAGGIARNMAPPDLQTIEGSETAAVQERASEEESQRSCFLHLSFEDGPIMWDNNSVIASDHSNRLADIDRARENAVPSQAPQTPAQRSLPLLQPSSRSSASSGRSKSFPAQKNNLLSWMNVLLSRPSVNSNGSTLARQRRPSDSSPSPALSVIQTAAATNPAPAAHVPPGLSPRPEPAAIPEPIAPRDAVASPVLTERTALKLAKQLRNFQGCTHVQHHEADRLHQEHHQRPDITGVLRGNNRAAPLPDVLRSPKLMKPADINGLDYRAAFEGSDHSTYLSKQDQELWYDAILSPALNKTVDSSNVTIHYPATARIVEIDSTAISGERFSRKDSSREQLLHYTIQPQYLDALWSLILESIAANPGCHRFQGATLFMHAKNTKLDFMDKAGSLNTAYNSWENQWSKATDPQFYNKDHTFVDLAKQVTSEDSALPYDEIPAHHEAEVVLSANGSPAKGNPKRSTYPWATMRDTMGQTFFATPRGKESQDGLTPFDTSKNLALDPRYIRSLQQEGGGISFSKAKRAYANLLDNRWKSYELLGFLYAQINKYCFLFEHILAHTAMTYSLPETIVMVTALRALRFCYSSNQLQRESLLYKDRWENIRNQRPVIKEGMGMRDTIQRCGLENILVGNVLMHEEYKRRWRAVKDLRDVYVRFNQAESWYDRYNWLEYLHVLNLEQFDTDRSPELTPEAIQQKGEIRFWFHDMKNMFSIDHSIGYRKAEEWLDEFFQLIRLTHWVLPYPSNAYFIMSTKTNRNQGLKGRMMWFSVVYANPEKVALPIRSHPRTLYDILWNARREAFGDGRDQQGWSTVQLISACRAQGVKIYGREEAEEYWVVGRTAGLKGFKPVWERTRPARLEMLEQIKGKSLDELEDLMGRFGRDLTGNDIQDAVEDVGDSARVRNNGEESDNDSQPRSAGSGSLFVPSVDR